MIEATRAAQQRTQFSAASYTTPEQCVEGMRESAAETEKLARALRGFGRQNEFLQAVVEYNEQKERFLRRLLS